MLWSGAHAWGDEISCGIQVRQCGADATVLVNREGADPVRHIQGPRARKLRAERLEVTLLQQLNYGVIALRLQRVSQYGAQEIA